MAENIEKPAGPLSRSADITQQASPQITAKIGVVKSNVDDNRSNTIQVYISDLNKGYAEDDERSWTQVRYLSPFFGFTRPTSPDSDLGTYKGNPSSYGMWMSPPDIGTQVLCIFELGDINKGFYIGCVPNPDVLHMVPAIGATDNIVTNKSEATSYGGATRLPVTNINTNNQNITATNSFLNETKPVHSYAASIMFQQGILRDPIRGPIGTSAQRESPSRVGWGVSTPGRPIYDGGFDDETILQNLDPKKAKELRVVSRRGGHSIIMDDGDLAGQDDLIRIRTARGHQITMSDNGQTLMILHGNGQSYIELGKEGTVDIYATNSINLRTHGDLNLHADNDVNIHANKNLNIHGENIKINSDENFSQRAGGSTTHFTTGDHTHKVGGAFAVSTGDEASILSQSFTYINGSKVFLNSGKPGVKPSDVSPIDKLPHNDTLFDKDKGYLAAPVKLYSIASRAPAHAPWAMAGMGVNIKTSLAAEQALPPAPSDSVQAVNDAADTVAKSSVSPAVVASAPQIPAISTELNTKVSQALSATAATDTGTGLYKDAKTEGTAIVKNADGMTEVAAGGSIALNTKQMETAGVLKPGSSTVITAVAERTGNAKLAFSPTLFATGSLTSFTTNPVQQATALSACVSNAQSCLQTAGVFTGKETATQIAGLSYASAQNGAAAVVGALQAGAAAQAAGPLAAAAAVSAAGPAASQALASIGSGNAAASIAKGLKGPLSGLQESLTAMKDKYTASILRAKGLAAGAFDQIKKGMEKLEAGKPQNLTELAKKKAESVAKSGLAAAVNTAVAANPTLAVGVAAASAVATNVSTSGAASTVASGLSNLPGGASAASAVNNLAAGDVPGLPGTATLKDAMASAGTTALNSAIAANPGAAAALAAASALTSSLSKNSLASTLKGVLPAGAAAQLMNSIQSVATAGSGIKMPTAATNTVDRSSVDEATKSQLGDPKIPAPDFSSKSPVLDAYNDLVDKAKQQTKLNKEYQKLLAEYNKAVQKFNNEQTIPLEQLNNKLIAAGLDPAVGPPAGHPLKEEAKAIYQKIKAAQVALEEKRTKLEAALAKAEDFYKQEYLAARQAMGDSVKG